MELKDVKHDDFVELLRVCPLIALQLFCSKFTSSLDHLQLIYPDRAKVRWDTVAGIAKLADMFEITTVR